MAIIHPSPFSATTDQKPEARAAARTAALTAGKQKKQAAEEAKKSNKVRPIITILPVRNCLKADYDTTLILQPAGKSAQPKMSKKDMKAGGKR